MRHHHVIIDQVEEEQIVPMVVLRLEARVLTDRFGNAKLYSEECSEIHLFDSQPDPLSNGAKVGRI